MPPWLKKLAIGDTRPSRKRKGMIDRTRIRNGQRNVKLTSIAGTMRSQGLSKEAIEAALLEHNRPKCDPPLDDAEVRRIAASVSRYKLEEQSNKRKKFVIVPEQAKVVRRIFELRAAGKSMRMIAQILNAEGIPSPRNRKWQISGILAMLRNETYLGRIISGMRKLTKGKPGVQKRDRSEWIICKDAHDPIITTELWEAVRMQDSATMKGGHRGKPRGPSRHLWSGFLQ